MIQNSFDNYNLFILAIVILLITLIMNKIVKKVLYILCILLLGMFIYFQFKFFHFDDASTFDDYKIVITNYLFALCSVFLMINLIYYTIY